MSKTRRGRNEGSVRFKKSKNLYEARYPIGLKEVIGKDGKPYAKTIYKSIYGKLKTGPNGVLAKMRDALAALGKGEYVDPSNVTLASWCKDWYETYEKSSIRINTQEKYETSLKRLKKYDIAYCQLKNVNQEIIQKFYNRLHDDKYDEDTIKATHTLINGALDKAEDLRMVIKNEARKCIIPKNELFDDADEHEARALTAKQEKAFLYQLGRRTKYYMFALFMANTGLRPGEAKALNREDVNLQKGTAKVSKTFIEKIKKNQSVPKTEASKRTVPIPSEIIPLLKECMLTQPKKGSKDPLFQTSTGKRPTMSYLRKRFKAAGKAVGCDWVNLHTMRHTFASKLFQKKIDIKIISKLLGHKDVRTTYDIYVHFIDNVVEESVQVLNEDLPDRLPQKSRKGEKKNKKKSNIVGIEQAVSTH